MDIIHDVASEISPGAATRQGGNPDWWRGAVIYQIYPRSFQDTDGDGIGDLRGITQRLPHIASLGVDAIWISPFFQSPMLDYGYDVSDYRAVDPMFGTQADFEGLVAEAHRLGLKVMIDQVISHTSDRHAWFVESRSSHNNPHADWYVWADARPDGTPPNNWLSIFGGSAWEWDTTRCQYYLHNFLSSQPDLNFHNPQVQDALLDAVRFWLDLGVDGFRLDTINFYFHSAGLEDNPPLAVSERNASIAPAVNPYNFQEHIYDKNRPENLDFLRRFRALLDEYPDTAAVGEVGDAQRGVEIVGQYTSGGDKVHMCYAFDFLSAEPLSPTRIKDVIEAFEAGAPQGWSCWAFSNHDVVRHASRWADRMSDRDGFLRMAITLILSLRGSVCLYQGEELGLGEAVLSFEDLRDPYGIRFWPVFKGRDGCRTPMVWNELQPNAGFSTARPWLPVPPEHLHLAVATQDQNEDSLLAHYRAALACRSAHREFAKGGIEITGASDVVLSFRRTLDGEAIRVWFNFSEEVAEEAIDMERFERLDAPDARSEVDGGVLRLQPFGSFFAREKLTQG